MLGAQGTRDRRLATLEEEDHLVDVAPVRLA
jgi:hypothetical protein